MEQKTYPLPGTCWTCKSEFKEGFVSRYNITPTEHTGPYLLCEACSLAEKTRGLVVFRGSDPGLELGCSMKPFSEHTLTCDSCEKEKAETILTYNYRIEDPSTTEEEKNMERIIADNLDVPLPDR